MCLTILLCSVFFVAQNAHTGEMRIAAPLTSPAVMIDGVLSEGEWEKASQIEVPGLARLYFQRSADFVFMAVEYTHFPSGTVDLYLSPREGEIYDLHASAKLGERQLQTGIFPDWVWWNNRDWTANVSRADSFEKPSFLPARVREYQIRRTRFPSHVWRLRFELIAMDANNVTESKAVFPPDTSDKSTSGWLSVEIQ